MRNLLVLLLCLPLLSGWEGAPLHAQTNLSFGDALPSSFPNRTFSDERVYQITQARQLIRNGQWEHAVLSFDVALSQQPYWIPALVGRADVLDRMGRRLEAQRDWSAALKLNPKATELLMVRGRKDPLRFLALYPEQWFARHGFEPRASLDRLRAVGADIENFDYFQFQAKRIASAPDSCSITQLLRYKLTGDYQSFEELVEIPNLNAESNEAVLQMLTGNLQLIRHEYLEAIARYNRAFQQAEETWPELFYNRGLAYVLLDNYNNGCDDLYQSVQLGFLPAAEVYEHVCNF